jgi:hypothetical protein
MRPGRCKIYNNKGQKATEAIPDALIPRLQFVRKPSLAAASACIHFGENDDKPLINHD